MAEAPQARRILLVEDNPDDRARVQRMLRGHRREYRVESSTSGEDGLAKIAAGARYDCVLLDYRLPDMDGTEFLRRLRSAAGLPVAVCMITGHEDDEAAAEVLGLGAEDYLLKDALTPYALVRAIENVVEKFEIRRQLESQRAALDLRNERLESMRQELETRLTELSTATQARDRFVAMMSHEMRTPLNAILGYAELLELEIEGSINDHQRRNLDRIRVGSRHLLDLINDVLDLARADARKLELDLRPVDPGAVIEEVCALLENEAANKGLTITHESEPRLPLVLADLQRLRQILTNLVGNAIKFTEDGGIDVRASRTPSGSVAITVTDTGIGIPPDSMELVFSEFYQADNTFTRSRGGSGLGLAISQRLARAMGGDIEVESTLGEGSRFTIVLPPAEAGSEVRPQDTALHDARMAQHASRPQDAEGEAVPVVAFSDDPATLAALQARVAPAVRLVWTIDPDEVAALAERENASLVILDIGSKEGATWRVAHAVAEAPLSVPPAILLLPVLVASRAAAGGAASVDLGWVALVPKPFTADQLTNAVSTAAGRFSQRARRGATTEDRNAYDVLVIDDDADSRRVASRFLTDQGMSVRESVDGESGLVEMRLRPPDVAVLDLMMPVLDGFGVLAAMRADPLLASIPVVVLTAKTLTEAERQFLTRTAVRVLQKGEHRLADIASLVLRAAERAHAATQEPSTGEAVI
ncbi:MAG TPA: response regulator [Gemmatimonadaceae bacterium]|nr:response regulator [Gemmatimonadaceae bacterium]